MREFLKNHCLIILSVLGLVIYHGYSLGRITPDWEWKLESLASTRKKRKTTLISLPASRGKDGVQAIDRSSAALKGLGAVFRYSAGQYRGDILVGNATPYRTLFLREEAPFLYTAKKEQIRSGYLELLKPLKQALAAHGVHLVLVPVPLKVALERDRLSAKEVALYASEPVTRAKTESPGEVYQALAASDSETIINLHSLYSAADPGAIEDPLFVPSDSNWSSRGLALAARAVVENLHHRGLASAPGSLTRVGTRSHREVLSDKSMLRGLQLPDWYVANHPDFAWNEPIYDFSVPASPGLNRSRLFLTGTCFASRFKGRPESFGALLSRALSVPLIDFSEPGSHGVHSLAALRASPHRLRRGDILVLEFAFRQPWNPNEPLAIPRFAEDEEELDAKT